MKLTPEQARLKQFMLDHFCFATMKQIGFWPKGTRRADFEAQAARVCEYFGYESVYEYGRELAEITEVTCTDDLTGQTVGAGVAVATWPGKVNEAGELIAGDSALLSICESTLECPHCTCQQEIKKPDYHRFKCKGCKRTLWAAVGLTGKIQVWDR